MEFESAGRQGVCLSGRLAVGSKLAVQEAKLLANVNWESRIRVVPPPPPARHMQAPNGEPGLASLNSDRDQTAVAAELQWIK